MSWTAEKPIVHPKPGLDRAPPTNVIKLFIYKTILANEAETEYARRQYCDERRGVLDAVEVLYGQYGAGCCVMAADEHYLKQHPHSYEGRMTGGLHHDWKPREVEQKW